MLSLLLKWTTLSVVWVLVNGLSADFAGWLYATCPTECQCEMRHSQIYDATLRTVDCARRQLLELPKLDTIPTDVQVLLLEDNLIKHLPMERALWLPDLLFVNLSGNAIDSLPAPQGVNGKASQLFEGLYNVRQLDLSRNHLADLASNTLQGLFNLQTLDLHKNRLASIANDAFRGLMKLETLNLSTNRLTYVQHDAWRHVDSLYELDLGSNQLTVLQSEAFKSLRRLRHLNLASNRLARVDEHAFGGLFALETIDFAGNQLRRAPADSLRPVRSTLRSLTLDANPIVRLNIEDVANFPELRDVSLSSLWHLRVVERGALKRLPSLVLVRLHDNPRLAYVDPVAFVDTPALTHLLIHNNNLTVLDKELVDSLVNVQTISLYGNPLTCDCNIRWIYDIINSEHPKIDFQESSRLVCASPAAHQFKLFAELSQDDLAVGCVPRILPIMPDVATVQLGASHIFDCRAVGIPTPRLYWLAPDGGRIDPASYHPRRQLRNGGASLQLRHAQLADSGVYSCVVESSAGSDIAHVHVNVQSVQVYLTPIHIDPNSVTVRWTGADRADHVFQLLYRMYDRSHNHYTYAGTVTPLMTSFTVNNLRADSTYELCLALEHTRNVLTHVACELVRTSHDGVAQQDASFMDRIALAVRRNTNLVIGLTVTVLTCLLLLLTLVIIAVTRATRQSQEPRYDSLSDLDVSKESPMKAKLMSPSLSPSQNDLSTLTSRTPENVYTALIAGWKSRPATGKSDLLVV